MALADPHPVKGQQAPGTLVSVRTAHVRAERQGFFHPDRLPAVIDDPHASHDGIRILENGIGEQETDVDHRVLQGDLQGHGPLLRTERRRQPRKAFFSAIDTVGDIIGLQSGVAGLRADRHCALAVVPGQFAGKLVLHDQEDLPPVPRILRSQKGGFLVAQQIAQVAVPEPPAEIDMLQKLLVVHHGHHIADMVCIDLKDPVFLEIADVHLFFLL